MLPYRLVVTFADQTNPFLLNIADLGTLQTPDGGVLFSATHLGGGLASYVVSAADAPLRLISALAYRTDQTYLDRPQAALAMIDGQMALIAAGLTNAASNVLSVDKSGGLALASDGKFAALGAGLTHIGSVETPEGRFLYTARDASTTLQTWRIGEAGTFSHASTATLPQGTALASPAEFDDLVLTALGTDNSSPGSRRLGTGSRSRNCGRMARSERRRCCCPNEGWVSTRRVRSRRSASRARPI
ncbi:hypothetical protein [Paracoccus ravus]|uniref:hypothetical protein n=1 Tax=Paracoccus ravus TaxID=2447760 RepID=UPI00106EAE78|nr:hypothetical protein [Paracoccus ravus]